MIKQIFLSLWLIGTLASCSHYFHQPLRTSTARLGAETQEYKVLTSLPEPEKKIAAAVYRFRDLTGQYRPTENGAGFSNAVTQGSSSILLKALEESNWFTLIEREGFSNLSTERSVIKKSRANYQKNKNASLPPLLFAGLILEGGIVSFDSNIKTGGAGARYFGTGGSTQYREDRITIYLRAVSTTNGRILKTVYTSKTILSQKVDVGIFRFVSLRRLLEAETGFTYNEPSDMAVKEAIEKAVISLVIEGIIDGLWKTKAPEGAESPVVKAYKKEKEENVKIDIHGMQFEKRRSPIAVGVGGGGLLYYGDFNGAQLFPSGHINFSYKADQPISYQLEMSYGKLGTEDAYQGTFAGAQIGATYRLFNQAKFSPFFQGNAGAIIETKNNIDRAIDNTLRPFVAGGVGIEQLIHNRLGFKASVNYYQTFSDSLDGLSQGRFDDAYWGGNVGLAFYLR